MGQYTVNVAVQDRSGTINNYVVPVSISGGEYVCDISAFLISYGLAIVALLVLFAAAFLVFLRKKRSQYPRLFKVLFWTAVVGSIILLVYFLFFY